MMAVHLIILLALLEYMVFIMLVGASRGKYGVAAPSTTGNKHWERLHRIQVNTTEQLVLFLPSLYLFSHYVDPLWATLLGSIYLLGRLVYFFTYKSNPDKRMLGAMLTTLPSYIMVIATIFAVVSDLFLNVA